MDVWKKEMKYTIADICALPDGECEVFPVPFAIFINQDERNYVEPDISVICDKDRITDRGCNGAPDWVIAVVSPGSRSMDYITKLFK